MQIRNVDPSYLAFLSRFDPHIPQKSDRPWLWPVRVDGMDYGVPLTSQETAAGYIGWLRCSRSEHGLYLRYMIPVPEAALRPARPLTESLKEELEFWELNRKYVEEEAEIIHRLSVRRQMSNVFLNHCCDFSILDRVYLKWQPGRDAGHFLCSEEGNRMPISKKGIAYYTKEQYETAKYNGDALKYAQSQGYDLVRQNGYYKMKEHDSMVFTPTGRWFWNSRGVHGGALEFMMYYEGKTITEAVLTLAGEREHTAVSSLGQSVSQRPASQPKPDAPRYEFRLPDKAPDFKRLFGYLCGDRGLDKSVVQEMIRQNRLYQSAAKTQSGKVLNNATFVYQDPQGKVVGAFQRGMYDREGFAPYKRDAPGSDKRWGWMLASPFNPPTEVRVFEAAIDAASDASLYAMPGMYDGDWRQEPVDRLSLEGLSIQPLQNYLQLHPDVRKVTLMLDGDEPGRKAARQIAEQLTSQGYQVEDREPPYGKDWNEVLKATRSMGFEMQATQQPEAPEL